MTQECRNFDVRFDAIVHGIHRSSRSSDGRRWLVIFLLKTDLC